MLLFFIKIFVLSDFQWLFYRGGTVYQWPRLLSVLMRQFDLLFHCLLFLPIFVFFCAWSLFGNAVLSAFFLLTL